MSAFIDFDSRYQRCRDVRDLHPPPRSLCDDSKEWCLVLGLALGLIGFAGCSDEARQSGTQVEYDKKAHEEGQNRMREYMEKKARGEVSGIPKARAKSR